MSCILKPNAWIIFNYVKKRTPWPKIKPWSFIVVLWNTRCPVNQETRVRFRGLARWYLYFFRWFRFRMWLFCSLAGALDRCSTGYFLSVCINFFYRIFFTAVFMWLDLFLCLTSFCIILNLFISILHPLHCFIRPVEMLFYSMRTTILSG